MNSERCIYVLVFSYVYELFGKIFMQKSSHVGRRVLIFFASPRLVHHVCDRAEALPAGRWIENAKRIRTINSCCTEKGAEPRCVGWAL